MLIPRSTRMRERIALPLQAQVDCRESASHHWTQLTQLLDVSQHGAGLELKRPTEPGRLLKLAIPLPSQLRTFDLAEPQYVVWGVVRHISFPPATNVESTNDFRVGVAFVGRTPPSSFGVDPATRFEAAPPDPEEVAMWTVTNERPSGGKGNERRRDTRHVIPIEVTIESFDEDGERDDYELTVTELISGRGASVRTNLSLDVGRFVRISSERDQVSMFAAVRSRIEGLDAITRVGLEFLNGCWPLEGA
jgi:PilZ domain